jgi:glycine cleavage system regulatory protein
VSWRAAGRASFPTNSLIKALIINGIRRSLCVAVQLKIRDIGREFAFSLQISCSPDASTLHPRLTLSRGMLPKCIKSCRGH